MLPFRLIYHDRYDLSLRGHVFPSQKYRLIRERLLQDGIVQSEDFEQPTSASEQDLLRVHDADWIRRLLRGTLSMEEILRLEIPYSRTAMEAVLLATGGAVLACERALRDRIAINLGGGFHHAFHSHGEGFCAVNDIAVAARAHQSSGRVARVMVVDCDVHQGNGTASLFAEDTSVYTFSIHQRENYPAFKPPSGTDVELPDGIGDEEYLAVLKAHLLPALDSFHPDLMIYVAGADPFHDDQLGGLGLTQEGLARRDRFVFETALDHAIPVAVVLAGGYARQVGDTVTIHVNSVLAARDALAALRRQGACF